MTSAETSIAALYLGYFNRAPDPAGFAYWIERLDEGMPLAQIAESFSVQPEARALYPFLVDRDNRSPEDFLNTVYDNLFNRPPDDAGRDYWLDQLSGETRVGDAIIDIISGAVTDPDKAIIDNKTEAGFYWVDEVRSADAAYDYAAEGGPAAATDAIAGITDDDQTVAASRTRTDLYVGELTDDKDTPGAGTERDVGDEKIITFDINATRFDGDLTPSTAAGNDLINIEAFRADPRFAGIDGSGQTVVVIDTGIDLDHPAFGGDSNGDGVSDSIIFARDFSRDNDGTADDVQGHGTHVTSIIASQLDAYPGVAPGVNIVALQALGNDGSGAGIDIERALQWTIENAESLNIAAVNLSLGNPETNVGGPTSAPGYTDELAELVRLGVVPVAAAGNEYQRYQNPGTSSLSADPNALAIGAVWADDVGQVGGDFTTGADRLTAFSQRSDAVASIFAPGGGILGAAPGGGSVVLSGTSMATPYVSGMVALAQQLALQELGRTLSFDEISNLLSSSASTIFDGDDENDNVENTFTNYDRVDMLAFAEAIIALDGDPGTTPPPPSGDDIPGDISSGETIAVGGTRTSAIDTAEDQDFYAVELQAGQRYLIELLGQPSGAGTLADPLVALYSSAGAFIASDDDSGASLESELDVVASETGTYFISAEAFGDNTGSYELKITQAAGETGEIPGDPSTGATIAPGQTVAGTLDVGGDTDWYRVELTTGEVYEITLDGVTMRDPYLYLYDQNGTLLLSDDDGGEGFNSALLVEITQGGTFFLEAASFSLNDTGTYALAVQSLGASGDDFAADPSTNGALNADSGTAQGMLENDGDRDWFAFDVTANTRYQILLTGDDGPDGLSDPYLRVLDASGVQLAFNDDIGDGSGALDSGLEFLATETGRVYVSAGAYSDFGTGSYTLTSQSLGTVTGDIADDGSTTTFLSPGQSLSSTIDQPGDLDVVGFQATAGQSYTISMVSSGPDPLLDPYVELFAPSGSYLTFDDDGGAGVNAELTFTAFESGTHFIRAQAYDLERDAGTYTLDLTAGDPGDIVADDISTNANVQVGVPVRGTIDTLGDVDVYAFFAGAGGIFDFRLDGAGPSPLSDPFLAVLDSAGAVLATNDDSNGTLNSQIVLEGFPGEVLYVVADAYEGNFTGQYDLSVTFLEVA